MILQLTSNLRDFRNMTGLPTRELAGLSAEAESRWMAPPSAWFARFGKLVSVTLVAVLGPLKGITAASRSLLLLAFGWLTLVKLFMTQFRPLATASLGLALVSS